MPLELGAFAAALAAFATGFGFGFVLERGGLADARRLAAQFYFRDVRVLKVMFTAIVVAMLGVYGLAGLGLVDLSWVYVNPTNLGPGILGGLLLGCGFIIGGYCPGTSLLAAATLKQDAWAFLGGALLGVFAFGETVGLYDTWYETAGAHGRLTLPELFDVDAGWLALGVVLMAVGAFRAGERAERRFGGVEPRGLSRLAPALLVVGGVVAAIGGPTPEARLRWIEPALDARLEAGEAQLDPAELLALMHNRQVELKLVDVRDEADFNLFHLLDARRWTLTELARAPLGFTPRTVVVVVGNGEGRARQAWKLLEARGVTNAFLLEGGVNLWLDVFRGGQLQAAAPDGPDDALRHTFPSALGGRWPASRPAADAAAGRVFTSKAKLVTPRARTGGGCG